MEEKIEVNQKSALGSQTTQIGVQNNIGLSPADAMQMALDMFRAYFPQLKQEALQEVKQIVTERLSLIPPERIAQPSAKIVIPALENASITEEPELRKMYANLIANSMDSVVRKGVHPAFVEIINQLSPNEAKVIGHCYYVKSVPTITLRAGNDGNSTRDIVKDFSNVGDIAKCDYPLDICKYFNNLIRLGIIERAPAFASLSNKRIYEPIKNHPFIQNKIYEIKAREEYNIPQIVESYFYLTDFGAAFCEICL